MLFVPRFLPPAGVRVGACRLLPLLLCLLAGCANVLRDAPTPTRSEALRTSLPVAEAALNAGQVDVAKRLYRSLSDHVPQSVEPLLALGRIGLAQGLFAQAEADFAAAARRATKRSPHFAAALLGAGRAARFAGRAGDARDHFLWGLRHVPAGSASAARLEGAVAAVDASVGGFRRALGRSERALSVLPDDPRLLSNHLRILHALGRTGEARALHARRDAAFWPPGDASALAGLFGGAPSAAPPPADQRASDALRLRLTPAPVLPRARAPALRLRGRVFALTPTGPALSPLRLLVGHATRVALDLPVVSVLVSDPLVAEAKLLSADVLYVSALGVGRTTVSVLDDARRVVEREIIVSLDTSALRAALADEPAFASVVLRPLARGVLLSGSVASAEVAARASRVIASLLPEDVPVENALAITTPQQVSLEVQIAEVSRSITESLGVSWTLFGASEDTSALFRVGSLDSATFIPTPVEGIIPPSLGLSHTSARLGFSGLVDALSAAGLANVLARPNVTAVSGETASFFSGGEHPIPAGYESDTNTLLFEYRKVGVLLDFVPTVVDSGRIVLTVRPEVSEPDFSRPLVIGPVPLPVINVRRAETTVEVADGQSIVIAGLFRNRTQTDESGLPGLKDLPALGALFSRRASRTDELELIVIVTARLVVPQAAPAARDEAPSSPPPPARFGAFHY